METASPTKAALTPAHQKALSSFDSLPDSAFVDVQVVAALKGVHIQTIWRWARTGFIVKPVKLAPQTTRWNVGALRRSLPQ